jgi:phosphorylcholine metabolism protein LicD
MRDLVVKILVSIGLYKPVIELIKKAKFEIQAHRMHKDGLAMLADADEVFTKMGVRVFLTYGALLGAYREHGFISYDPDIDLGVLENELPVDLHERMEDAGFHLIRQNYIGTTGQVVEETYEYKKLHLDIFIYIRDGNDLYSVIQRKHESKEWKEANATDGGKWMPNRE